MDCLLRYAPFLSFLVFTCSQFFLGPLVSDFISALGRRAKLCGFHLWTVPTTEHHQHPLRESRQVERFSTELLDFSESTDTFPIYFPKKLGL